VPIQYENAPITEALIDIRVDLPASVTLGDIERLHDQLASRYPAKVKRVYLQSMLTTGVEPALATTQTQTGFAFHTSDNTQICQFRKDGFSFSRLRPYGNWTELRNEARRLWEIYRAALLPEKITRVAVRYINQIDIPAAQVDYKDYFRTTPEVSPDLPQGLSGFFMQLHFPQPEFQGLLVLTQTALQPARPDTHSIILDLDAFREQPELASDDQVWLLLEDLRKSKNVFFEGSITDKTRELFGPKKEY
jgi:uncharacterized protein (TIGR04255 family)